MGQWGFWHGRKAKLNGQEKAAVSFMELAFELVGGDSEQGHGKSGLYLILLQCIVNIL